MISLLDLSDFYVEQHYDLLKVGSEGDGYPLFVGDFNENLNLFGVSGDLISSNGSLFFHSSSRQSVNILY